MSACLNCGGNLSGAYCAACGQKDIGRLDGKDLGEAVLENAFSWESSVVRTFAGLTVAPGRVAREYVAGKRRSYVNPVKYFLYSTAFLILMMRLMRVKTSDFANASVQANLGQNEELRAVNEYLQVFTNEHMQLLTFTMVPIFVLVFRRILRRHDLNLAEHAIPVVYMFGHSLLVVSVPMLAAVRSSPFAALPFTLISILYYSWMTRSFYGCGWLLALVATLVAYFLWVAILLLALGVSATTALLMSR